MFLLVAFFGLIMQAIATIEEIRKQNNNKVQLRIKHSELEENVYIEHEKNNQKLKNLISYHKITSVEELEGKNILIQKLNNSLLVLYPSNKSFIAKLKYKYYLPVDNIYQKMTWFSKHNTSFKNISYISIGLFFAFFAVLFYYYVNVTTTVRQISLILGLIIGLRIFFVELFAPLLCFTARYDFLVDRVQEN